MENYQKMDYQNKKNYGFIEPEIKDEDYRFGSGQIDVPILRLDGQWDTFLPIDEKQNLNGLESFNCTAFGITSQIEILLRAKYNL